MKTIKAMIWLLVVALGLGIGILSLPQAVNAQTDKAKKEKKQERDDDDKDDGEKLSREDRKSVKISIEHARTIALGRINGTVIEEELEKEDGRLLYAFDVRDANGKIFGVEIDAMTGEVLQATEDDQDGDNDDDEKLSAEDAKLAKISLGEARMIALKRIGGKVIEEELEKENGKLQYAFDIRDSSGKIWDVEIDAMTGEVLKATDEDDEDGDNQQSGLTRTKKSVYRAAKKVKNITVRTVGKLF